MPSPEIIIAGFGLPGRSVARAMAGQKKSYCVIEMNTKTVESRIAANMPMIAGDAKDPEVLRKAGIESARVLVVAVPNDDAALEILRSAKSINPDVRVIVRCAFTSAGFKALQAGASEVVIAEQVVAEQLTRAVLQGHPSHS
ncbi:MAG TPA: NAD(P)-binding protein [Tepidisphaeraceae bacterium]|nr:NAD(P)-binding protein [Tepidisphaeraceae bacterium]